MDSELGALANFLGSWTSRVTTESMQGVTSVYTSRTTFERGDGPWIMRDTGASPDSENRHLGMWRRTDQPHLFRSSYFMRPSGATLEFTHRWDEQARKMTGRAELADGVTIETSDRFIAAREYHWTAVMKSADGQVLANTTGESIRHVFVE